MKKILTLLIIHKDGKILLGMKKRGFRMGRWNGFGGKIHDGETIEDATKRELLEESELTVNVMEKIGVVEFSWKEKPDIILEANIFKATDFLGELTESDEMKPQWFSTKDIPYDKMWSDDKYWIPLLLENKKFKGKFVFDDNNNVLDYELIDLSPNKVCDEN